MSKRKWETSLAFLKAHASEAACIGEIGLDYKYATTPEEKRIQERAFLDQMAVAAEHRLPINLHSRRALRDTMEQAVTFHKATGLPALIHWFAHSQKLLKRTNEEGIFVSVGPSVLFSNDALALAALINPRLILVETDSPIAFKGNPSTPAWAAEVAETLVNKHPQQALTEEKLIGNTLRYLNLSMEP
jgi:TatD DNase family protein